MASTAPIVNRFSVKVMPNHGAKIIVATFAASKSVVIQVPSSADREHALDIRKGQGGYLLIQDRQQGSQENPNETGGETGRKGGLCRGLRGCPSGQHRKRGLARHLTSRGRADFRHCSRTRPTPWAGGLQACDAAMAS